MKKAILGAVLAGAVLCSGCSLLGDLPDDAPDGVYSVEDATPSPVPTGDEEGIPLSEEAVQALLEEQNWEGVYESGGTKAVIQSQEGDCAILSVLLDGTDVLSGYMQLVDGTAIYSKEEYGITMTLEGDTLTMAVSGTLPEGIALPETLTRNGEDTANYPVTFGVASLPASVSETVVDGKIVLVYVDPQGRFSAMLPSAFVSESEENRPADGICLVSRDGTVRGVIAVQEAGEDTPETIEAAQKAAHPDGEVTKTADGGVLSKYTSTETGEALVTATLYTVSGSNEITITLTYPESVSAYDLYTQDLAVSVS